MNYKRRPQLPLRMKNDVREPFNAWDMALIVAVGLLLATAIAYADPFYNQNFDGLSLGEICGQDNWYCSATGTDTMAISNSYAHSGTNAFVSCDVENNGTKIIINDEIGDHTQSTTTFYVLGDELESGSSYWSGATIYLRDYDENKNFFTFSFGCSGGDCGGDDLVMATSTMAQDQCTFNEEEWIKIDVAIDTIGNEIGLQCNEEGWHYYEGTNPVNVVDQIQIAQDCGVVIAHTQIYFDDFGEDAPPIQQPDYKTAEIESIRDVYPEWQSQGGSWISQIWSQTHFSIRNIWKVEVACTDCPTDSYADFVNQQPKMTTTTYDLYQHTGTTTSFIVRATSTQLTCENERPPFGDCTHGILGIEDYAYMSWDESGEDWIVRWLIPELIPTSFDVDAYMTPGETYFIKNANGYFDDMDWLSSSTISIDEVADVPIFWIMRGFYNTTSSAWEFNAPSELAVVSGTSPEDYTDGLSTSTGDIVQDRGWLFNTLTKYLSFLNVNVSGQTYDLLGVIFSPNILFRKALNQFNLMEKVPFSYFVEIKDKVETELTDIGDHTASTTYGTIDIPYIGEINIMNIAQAKSDYSTQFTGIRTIIQYTLYIAFIFYIFGKVRSLGQ